MFNVRLAGGHLYGKQLSLMVSLMASFVLSFFPLDVLDEIWDLIESVSEGFLTYSWVPGHGLFFWVCWIFINGGADTVFLVLFCSFLCISTACFWVGIVIGMPNAPISVLARAAEGISGVDFLVVVPLTLSLYDVASAERFTVAFHHNF